MRPSEFTQAANENDCTVEPASRRSHIIALDGLRGIAAVCVLASHSAFTSLSFSKSYLAVDFFFILSGYVIGLAYDGRLQNSLSVWGYMRERLERLWPMLVIGAVVGLCIIPIVPRDGYFIPRGPYNHALAFLCQILLIPFVVSPGAFVFNGVQWSIVFELIANLAHAVLRPWLKPVVLAVIIGLNLIAVAYVAKTFHSINYGWGVDNFLRGLPRVGFGFFAGLALYRSRERWQPLLPRLPFFVLATALLVVLALPEYPVFGLNNGSRDIIAVAVLFPVVVALGSVSPSRGRTPYLLGLLSYPLYVLHVPLRDLAAFVAEKQLGFAASEALTLSTGAVIVLVCLAVGLLIDAPLNRWRKQRRVVTALRSPVTVGRS